MSNWTLAGFAVVVLIPLVMIFPKQELLRQASQQKLGDVLTVNYLTNLLKADPDNLELRILLAEHKIHLKEMEEVPPLIEPAIKSDRSVWQAKGLLTEYKYLTRPVFAEPERTRPQQSGAAGAKRIAAFHETGRARPGPCPRWCILPDRRINCTSAVFRALLYQTISEPSATMSTSWFAETAAARLARWEL